MIELLGAGGTIPIPNEVINGLANATLSRTLGWALTGAAVLVYAALSVWCDGRCRKSGLAAPPPSLTALKVIAAALAGTALLALCMVSRLASCAVAVMVAAARRKSAPASIR